MGLRRADDPTIRTAQRLVIELLPTCGASAPHLHDNGKLWFIPAGCLDDDPGTRIAQHIFVGSLASWDSISPGAAEFDEWGPEDEG